MSNTRAWAVIAIALALAGCNEEAALDTNAGIAPPTTPAAPTSQLSTTATSPTPTYATENQVASVIGRHAGTWQEAIDAATECRVWIILAKDDEPLNMVRKRTCLTNEAAMTLTTSQAAEDLGTLEPPPSMDKLVDETIAALTIVTSADMNGKCFAVEADSGSDECTEAMASALFGYGVLDDVLGGWLPYL